MKARNEITTKKLIDDEKFSELVENAIKEKGFAVILLEPPIPEIRNMREGTLSNDATDGYIVSYYTESHVRLLKELEEDFRGLGYNIEESKTLNPPGAASFSRLRIR